MKAEAVEVVRVTVAPRREMTGVVAAGLEGLCRVMDVPEEHAALLRSATEEVFSYALSTIRTSKINADISARFRTVGAGFQIVIEYPGIRGPLDHYLQTDHLHLLQVKTFEALGTCIARKLLDSLSAHFWSQEGINSYTLSLNTNAKAESVPPESEM